MTERPILFSGPMVRALLDGSKTQTRRVAKGVVAIHTRTCEALANIDSAGPRVACPYGKLGDRLWVRENGWERPELTQRQLREGADTWPPYEYDAEPVMCWADGELKAYGWKRRPSIHMPRWASRITLEVTGVRVERLQDISEADAMAEGVRNSLHLQGGRFAAENFAHLWWTINGEGSWEANPWVWVVQFKKIKGCGA